MDAQDAIRRLSFAQAQQSSIEAMVAMARHRAELAHAADVEHRSDAEFTDSLSDRLRDAHRVDKTA